MKLASRRCSRYVASLTPLPGLPSPCVASEWQASRARDYTLLPLCLSVTTEPSPALPSVRAHLQYYTVLHALSLTRAAPSRSTCIVYNVAHALLISCWFQGCAHAVPRTGVAAYRQSNDWDGTKTAA